MNNHNQQYHNRKFPLFFLLMVLLIFLISCSKSNQKDDLKIVEQAKNIASSPITQEIGNVTGQITEQTSQIILVPSKESEGQKITPYYKAPCILEKYRVLNVYCRGKNFWHNQSTLLSWYIPYSIVLFALIIVIFILWYLRRNH